MKITSIPSPNFTHGRKSYKPEAIVIHIMEGTLQGTDSWFSNKQSNVSAHYGIGKNGDIHQYVEEVNTAWHAGRVNAPTWNLIKPSKNGLFVNPNFYTIGIEHEGYEKSEWTPEMYEASGLLISEICKRWNITPDRSHIIGHHEIYSLKTCPGEKVDLNKLIDKVKSAMKFIAVDDFTSSSRVVTSITRLNLRSGSPSRSGGLIRTIEKNENIQVIGFTDKGEAISTTNGEEVSINKWYKTVDGFWLWSGGVKEIAS